MPPGYSISPEMLQPGDVIVSTTSAAVSGVIRAGTFSKVSHARIYLDGGELLEAVGEGVVVRSVDEAIGADTLTIVLRHKDMNYGKATLMMREAARHIGKKYDYTGVTVAAPAVTKGVVVHVLPLMSLVLAHGEAANLINQDAKFFCSELVSRLYENVNLKLVNAPAYRINPNEVYRSAVLRYAGNLKGGEN